jgi:DNA-nicking Smr family endonuclease
MDFKEILDAWEKKQAGGASAGRLDMEELLSRYPPTEPKEGDERSKPPQPRHKAQEPQASLDLHGMNSHEAEQALEKFVLECRGRGLQKVLIVHGKGHHSQGEPVLQGVVRRYLEKSPYTGAFGSAERKHGGRGATWVRLRKGRR